MLRNKREIQEVYNIIKNEVKILEESDSLTDKQIAYGLIRRIY